MDMQVSNWTAHVLAVCVMHATTVPLCSTCIMPDQDLDAVAEASTASSAPAGSPCCMVAVVARGLKACVARDLPQAG